MAYTAVQEGGNYAVYQNGTRIATTSAAGLVSYGLSPTNLNGTQANTQTGGTSAPISTSLIPTPTQVQNQSTKPAIPDTLYQQARTAMQNGTMTPQQAQSYLQSYINNGTYSGAVDTNTLWAPMQITKNGVAYNLSPDGSFQNASATTKTSTTSAATGNTSSSTIQPTGNPSLDAALGPLKTQIDALTTNGQIPTTLQITPELVGKFLSWAHAAVDPQTKQLLSAESANINASIKNAQTQYENTQAGVVQDFGTELAAEQNAAGANGTAFSGLRNKTEQNMVATANRTLASNASNTALGIGNTVRQGAADVGSANAGAFQLPTLAGPGTVSNLGGSRGTYSAGATPSLDFGYDPSLYTAGNIPTQQSKALNDLQGNYLSQYSQLAANNSNGTRSVDDLLGMISGKPSGV